MYDQHFQQPYYPPPVPLQQQYPPPPPPPSAVPVESYYSRYIQLNDQMAHLAAERDAILAQLARADKKIRRLKDENKEESVVHCYPFLHSPQVSDYKTSTPPYANSDMALELGGGWHQPDQLLLPPCNIEKFPALILMSNQTQQGRDVLDLIIQMKPSISTNYASDASSDKSDSDPEDQEEVCHRLYRRSMNHILSSTKLMGSSSNGKNKLRRPSTMSGHGGGGSGSGGLAHSFLSESMADLAAASVGLKSGGGHHQHGSSYLIGGGGGGGDLGDGSDSEMPKKRRRRGGKRDTRHDAKEAKNLPRDAAGNVIVPCLVGKPGAEQVTITSLGHIVHDREGFHSGRYIWPAGFTSLKSYVSLVNPGKRTVYTNKIIDTGADGPIFEVTAEDIPSDHPSGVFQGPSASGVWKKILVEMSAKGIVGPKTHVSGPEFYGLSDLGVIKAIQELPGAALCSKYTMQVWTSTEEGNNNNNNNNSNLNE